MDLSLSDDQEQLVRAVGRWVARSWSRGEAASTADRRSRWAELVGNGWTGLLSPTGMPLLDAALIVEQLGLGGCSLPVGPGGMIAPLVVAAAGFDSGSGCDQLLVVDGVAPGSVSARGLEIADRVVVLAATPGEDRRWWVAAEPAGAGSRVMVQVVQDEGRTVLSQLAVPDGELTWRPLDPGLGELAWLAGSVLSAAELVGLARAVLDGCVAYTKVRVQGGRPIGAHQAVQHRLADMLGQTEWARYLTYRAATTLGGTAGRALAVSAGGEGLAWPAHVVTTVHQAKALAARDCLAAIRSGHQVMGAIAYSAEHELHHLHKQAVVAAHEFGGAGWHWAALERLARG